MTQLLTLGGLCRHVRQSHDLRAADVARLAGISEATVKRFEDGARPKSRTFEAYLSALASPDAPNPLSGAQTDYLRRARDAAVSARRREEAFLCVSFGDTSNPRTARQFQPLLRKLASHGYPSMLCDELLFVHAVNSAAIRTLDQTATSPLLGRWPSWHFLGAVFQPGSSYSEVVPDPSGAHAVVGHFLAATLPWMFTAQMSALHRRLAQLSPDGFGAWWRASAALLMPEASDAIDGTWQFGGGLVRTTMVVADRTEVRYTPEHTAEFTLVSLEPRDAVSRDLLAESDGQVLLAHDYDKKGDFHVNTWPEVQAAVGA